MNCNEVIPLLSPFHDGELAPDEHGSVADHVASCAACSQELESIRRLSDLVESSPLPEAPDTLLQKLERSFDERAPFWSRFQFSLSRRSAVAALMATAAVVVVGLMIWQFVGAPPHSHEEMVQVFGEFLNAYEQGETSAVDVLARKYHGTLVSEAAATRALKRATVARPVILGGHAVAQRYLLKMPCCDCVQTNYAASGKTSFVLFEHEKEQAEWFHTRPMIGAECHGKACCLVQLKNGLAATWAVDGGYATVVGVRDVTELERLVGALQPL